jgi:hypothetical protein
MGSHDKIKYNHFDEEESKYMPFVAQTAKLNNNIEAINKASDKHNKKILIDDIEKIKNQFNPIKTIISRENRSLTNIDLTKIFNIFNEADNSYLNSLTLPDLELFYNNILLDKVYYEILNDANKVILIQKYFIIIPAIQLGLIQYDDILERMYDQVNDPAFKSRFELINTRNKEISKSILDNIDVYFRLIKKNCNDRAEEGEFINKSLHGMRKNISEITKKNSRQYALFQRIPIFNSACLEYYCNSELYNCFNIPESYNATSKYDTTIFDTINSKIQLENKNDLNIAIFGVLNISRNVNGFFFLFHSNTIVNISISCNSPSTLLQNNLIQSKIIIRLFLVIFITIVCLPFRIIRNLFIICAIYSTRHIIIIFINSASSLWSTRFWDFTSRLGKSQCFFCTIFR